MVLRDLSAPETAPPQLSQVAYRLPLGPVGDRFLAFILDFLILSPVVSFFLATSLRDLKTLQLINSESEEAVVIWFTFLIGMVVISCGLQACFLYFWQATPGQKFMQLRVISFPPRDDAEGLTFGQALTRTFGWWISTLFLGVPFIEVVGHPLRRCFHERTSDTLVVSLKQEYSDMPLPAETRYVGITMWMFFGILFIIGAVFMAKAYKAALLEGFNLNKAIANANICPAALSKDYKDQKRLDMVIALYASEQATDDCVLSEAQKVLWASDGDETPLAELAMAMISDDKAETALYHKKACEGGSKSEACALSKYLLSTRADRTDTLRRTGLGLVSSKVLLLNDAMAAGNFNAAASLMASLKAEAPLREYVDRNLVKAAWAVTNPVAGKNSGRQPASVEQSPVLKQFKTRFGIK